MSKRGRVSGGGETVDDRLRIICADYESKLATLQKQNDASQREIDRLIYEHIENASKLRERITELEAKQFKATFVTESGDEQPIKPCPFCAGVGIRLSVQFSTLAPVARRYFVRLPLVRLRGATGHNCQWRG